MNDEDAALNFVVASRFHGKDKPTAQEALQHEQDKH